MKWDGLYLLWVPKTIDTDLLCLGFFSHVDLADSFKFH